MSAPTLSSLASGWAQRWVGADRGRLHRALQHIQQRAERQREDSERDQHLQQ
jgi:hypothetical protein